ncbi:Morphine 6-dehydrogenase [Pleomorphomonas sp. T1.2MG-36]|uniref:aldo/keto reductase n=1 Tax=Pleomorphomonas sp. T1.2MG-36 TaxID=3041167 RepID=UPI0024779660|nr:aldo/keto reductase [Pleomorphomonas sp. T1.2MG-36]CAI9418757.1 Morphine 6-dehydrogenase [Pleomorphomonas sp. T1.2MG-36]
MAQTTPETTLANGLAMPLIGLGVYRSSPEETVTAVSAALATGYRLIDTAAAYRNEAEVGKALRQSTVGRNEVFLVTKLWISDYGYDEALHGFDRSMKKLGVDGVDLYLMHQPMPNEWERTVAAWKAVGRLYEEGRTKAIGVSNFSSELLTDLIERTGIVPHVNQVELHPFFTQPDLRATHQKLGIATQAWSPIGGVMRYVTDNPDAAPSPLSHPVVTGLAAKHGKTAAQVILRWHLQHGFCAIPKSVNPKRIAENFAVFDFALTDAEMASIDALDTGVRSGPNPADIDTRKYPLRIED